MLIVDNVTIRRGAEVVVSGISLAAQRGELIALLGPNGAGKTSFLRTLVGLIPIASGSISWEGMSSSDLGRKWYSHFGYCPDRAPLISELSVKDYLGIVRDIKSPNIPISAIDDVIEGLGLTSVQDRQCGDLSFGFRQRVSVAQAVLSSPDVIVLDEPTQGMDPEQVVFFRNYIRRVMVDRIVVMATHHLSELVHLDAIYYILDKGRCVDNGVASHSLEQRYLSILRG